jgi:hypothetical protein
MCSNQVRGRCFRALCHVAVGSGDALGLGEESSIELASSTRRTRRGRGKSRRAEGQLDRRRGPRPTRHRRSARPLPSRRPRASPWRCRLCHRGGGRSGCRWAGSCRTAAGCCCRRWPRAHPSSRTMLRWRMDPSAAISLRNAAPAVASSGEHIFFILHHDRVAVRGVHSVQDASLTTAILSACVLFCKINAASRTRSMNKNPVFY